MLSEREASEFRAKARDWLATHATDYLVPDPSRQGNLDTEEEFELFRRWSHAKGTSGWAGIHWPKHCGGQGLTRQHSILYELEESEYLVPRGSYLNVGWAFAAPTILAYGSREVQERLLPKIVTGEEFWCQLFSEPVAGSDLAGIRTRAERDGDEWVVNGQKVWTTYAQWADWAILVARHDFDLPKHKGLIYFYVDMQSPGIEVRGIREISGDSHFNEVFLDNVRIPDSQRLGQPGEGWQVALTTLMNERLGSGFTEAAPTVDDLLSLARQTELENGRASDCSDLRSQIADWYVASRGLELIRHQTISALSRGEQPGPEASITKIVNASQRQELSSLGLDLLEAAGSCGDPLGDLFRQGFFESPGSRIAGGTDEILRNVLAERVLGLPSDVRVDREPAFRELVSRQASG